LCIELWSVINFHCEIEPANLLHYIYWHVSYSPVDGRMLDQWNVYVCIQYCLLFFSFPHGEWSLRSPFRNVQEDWFIFLHVVCLIPLPYCFKLVLWCMNFSTEYSGKGLRQMSRSYTCSPPYCLHDEQLDSFCIHVFSCETLARDSHCHIVSTH
jgi:hypothetical protein